MTYFNGYLHPAAIPAGFEVGLDRKDRPGPLRLLAAPCAVTSINAGICRAIAGKLIVQVRVIEFRVAAETIVQCRGCSGIQNGDVAYQLSRPKAAYLCEYACHY